MPMCVANIHEDIDHLFFKCIFSNRVWNYLQITWYAGLSPKNVFWQPRGVSSTLSSLRLFTLLHGASGPRGMTGSSDIFGQPLGAGRPSSSMTSPCIPIGSRIRPNHCFSSGLMLCHDICDMTSIVHLYICCCCIFIGRFVKLLDSFYLVLSFL